MQLLGAGLCVCVTGIVQNPSAFLHVYQLGVRVFPCNPQLGVSYSRLLFSLLTGSALSAELRLMNLSGQGGFIELGKIYGFQPWVSGCE